MNRVLRLVGLETPQKRLSTLKRTIVIMAVGTGLLVVSNALTPDSKRISTLIDTYARNLEA